MNWQDFIENMLKVDWSDIEFKFAITIAAFAGFFILRALSGKFITRHAGKFQKKYVWRQTANYIATLILLLLIGFIWFDKFPLVFTFLSLISAALIITSKELVLNFVSYFVIIWRGLFDVGERIQIGERMGDVMETGPLYVALAEIGNWVSGDETTGRVIKIPNSHVLVHPVINYTRGHGYIWNEITVKVKKTEDWKKAKTLFLELGEKYSHQFSDKDLEDISHNYEELLFVKTSPGVYVKLKDEKVSVTLRYVCKFHKRREIEDKIWNEILDSIGDIL